MALPAVINALSEGGHLTSDGGPILTDKLALIVTLVATPSIMAVSANEDDFKSAAKAHFTRLFMKSKEGDSANVVKLTEYAKVLRRRLDFVAPLRQVPKPFQIET